MPIVYTRRAAQRAQLIQDGRKALELINAGRNIADCLLIIGGGRARLYRALTAASNGQYSGIKPRDPLLD